MFPGAVWCAYSLPDLAGRGVIFKLCKLAFLISVSQLQERENAANTQAVYNLFILELYRLQHSFQRLNRPAACACF